MPATEPNYIKRQEFVVETNQARNITSPAVPYCPQKLLSVLHSSLCLVPKEKYDDRGTFSGSVRPRFYDREPASSVLFVFAGTKDNISHVLERFSGVASRQRRELMHVDRKRSTENKYFEKSQGVLGFLYAPLDLRCTSA